MAKTRIKQPAIEAAQDKADVCRNHEPDRTCGRILRSA